MTRELLDPIDPLRVSLSANDPLCKSVSHGDKFGARPSPRRGRQLKLPSQKCVVGVREGTSTSHAAEKHRLGRKVSVRKLRIDGQLTVGRKNEEDGVADSMHDEEGGRHSQAKKGRITAPVGREDRRPVVRDWGARAVNRVRARSSQSGPTLVSRMNCQQCVRAQPRLSYEMDAPSLIAKRPSWGHPRTTSSHGLPCSLARVNARRSWTIEVKAPVSDQRRLDVDVCQCRRR